MGNSANDGVVARLDVLYRQGKQLNQELEQTFKSVDTAYLPIGPWSERPQRKPGFDYDQFEKDVAAKTAEWTKQVSDVLNNEIAQVRFRLQFDDPKRVFVSINHRYDKQLDRIEEVLDLFGDRVTALYEIIPKLEESIELAQPEPTKVESPEYDAKTKTLYFADEAIRFKQNAEFSPAICDLMINQHPATKLWRLEEFQELWDPQYEYVGAKRPSDWQRVHNVIQKLNLRVAKKTKINDLFMLSTGSVRINPKYQAKK